MRGLPPSIHEYRDAQMSGTGWVLGGADGVVFQSDVWRSWSANYGSNMGCVAPLSSGATLLAGYGFCSILSADLKERVLLDKGSFMSIATDGVVSLVASSSRVIAVTEAGGIIASLDLAEGRLLPRVYRISGKLVLFAPGNGTFEFTGSAFRPSAEFPWAAGQEVFPIVFSGSDSDYLAITTNGLYSSKAGVVSAFSADLRNRLKSRALDGAILFGTQIVLSSYYDGLSGYAIDDQRRLWNLPPSEFGGDIYFLRQIDDGMMVGSSSGVFVVPDPSRYAYRKIPIGDIHSIVQTPSGAAISVGSKEYSLDGTPLDFPDGTVSILPFQGGYVVASISGYLQLPTGARLSFADRDVPQMADLGDRFAVARGQKLGIYRDGALTNVPIPASVDSIAAENSRLLVGTDRGAFVLSQDGAIERTFGSGRTAVKALGDHGALAYDSEGLLYDSTGFVVGKFPFTEILSAVSWNGATLLLGRLPNGHSSIVRVGLSGAVSTLDLPVEYPLGLAVNKGRLCAICSGYVVEVADALPLALPSRSPRVTTLAGSTQLSLSASDDTVVLDIPPARLGPWAVPSFQYRVRGGKWEDVAPGAHLLVPRLGYGDSRLEVSTSMGDTVNVASFSVAREYPLWMRWPAFVLFGMVTAASFWVVLRWRVRRLAKEAMRLQALVDERTVDLKRAQAAREEFFSTLSHEIRNPLNGVVGLCDILSDAPPGSIGPREKRLVNTLKGCAGQLRGMLDDILDFGRIDRGEIQLSAETFDMTSAVDGAVRSVDVGLENCEMVLPHDPIWVSGDCGKLRQIVTNLASNGLKYGIPQKIRVTLASQVTREGKLAVQVAVSNTGTTITEKELSSLFKGFARGEDAIRRGIPGNGLGLAVSRRMAEAMGGSLTAQSHEGLTIFSLAVVLTLSDAPVEIAPTLHKPKLSRALAVEDEHYNRTVLGHLLGQLGYEVDWAVDGASAMDRITSGSYDLVLTDYLLPDTTGAALAARILAEAKSPTPPVIAVTAYSSSDKINELLKAGVSQIVSKPVSLEKLRNAISALSHPIGRRSLDVAPAKAACNFATILALDHGADLLGDYSKELPNAWSWTIETLDGDLAEAAKAVHEFRSKILVVEAMDAAVLAEKLESAVRLAKFSEIRRLADNLTPMVEDIASKAKSAAEKAGALRS